MQKTKSRQLSIISYNLKYHRANGELTNLVEQYGSDVLCVQECYSDLLTNYIGELKLADKTKANRLGLAIYYNEKRFEVIKTVSFPLEKAIHDRLLSPAEERLLVTKLYDKRSGQDILIGSFHAAPMSATNHIRRKQIKTAHEKLLSLGQSCPVIMVGDYNYPIFKRGLRICIEKSGYQLSLSDKPTYYMSKLIRGHFDLATYVNMQVEKVSTLPRGKSDHAPILIQATI
jgi:endonuclease/exonuclease/phosphatase family metal-dependent hydrolase